MLRTFVPVALLAAFACSAPAFAQAEPDADPFEGDAPAGDDTERETPARPMGELGPDTPAFTVRPGYRVSRATAPGLLRDAGFMAVAPRRIVFITEPAHGAIAMLRDEDRDGVYENAVSFVEDVPDVHGLQYHRGWLYYATPNAIYRARDTDGDLIADDIDTLVEGLPGDPGDRRTLLVSRGFVLTALADLDDQPTEDTLSDRQKIWRYGLTASGGKRLWASGIHDTPKLNIRPGTFDLWGIDRGPAAADSAGDTAADPSSLPPDEFNRFERGGFYGHPFLVGDNRPRPHAAGRPDLPELIARGTPPRWTFPARSGAGGWTFVNYRNRHFPADQRGDAFVALHGSPPAADAPPVGYRVDRVLFDAWTGDPFGALAVVSTLGGDDGREVLARPVDVVEAPGGSLFFSSDAPEPAIYRIEWTIPHAPAPSDADAPADTDDEEPAEDEPADTPGPDAPAPGPDAIEGV